MDFLIVVLTTIVAVNALLLIGLILIQQSKGGGFGSAFGGAGEAVFGAQMGTHLTKLTVVFTTVFFVLTLVLAIIIGHREGPKSAVEVNENLVEIESAKASNDGKGVTADGKNADNGDSKAKSEKNILSPKQSAKPVENKKESTPVKEVGK